MTQVKNFIKFSQKVESSMKEIEIKPASRVDQFRVGVFAYLVELLSSSASLLSCGHHKSAFILFRTTVEVAANLIAVCYDDDHAAWMQCKGLNSAIKMCKNCIDIAKDDALKKQAEDLRVNHENALGKLKAKYKITGSYDARWLFDRLGKGNMYIFYAMLCDRMHGGYLSIVKDHLKNIDEGFVDVGKPVDDGEANLFFIIVFEFVVESITEMYDLYGVESDAFKEAVDIYKEMVERSRSIGEAGQTKG